MLSCHFSSYIMYVRLFFLLKYQRYGDILHFSFDESTRYVQSFRSSLTLVAV